MHFIKLKNFLEGYFKENFTDSIEILETGYAVLDGQIKRYTVYFRNTNTDEYHHWSFDDKFNRK